MPQPLLTYYDKDHGKFFFLNNNIEAEEKKREGAYGEMRGQVEQLIHKLFFPLKNEEFSGVFRSIQELYMFPRVWETNMGMWR